jgi:hypothetical protein
MTAVTDQVYKSDEQKRARWQELGFETIYGDAWKAYSIAITAHAAAGHSQLRQRFAETTCVECNWSTSVMAWQGGMGFDMKPSREAALIEGPINDDGNRGGYLVIDPEF